MDLYVQEFPSTFLKNSNDEGLVTLKTDSVPPHCARIEKGLRCACSSKDGIVVSEQSITINNDAHLLCAFPCYALPNRCTLEEQKTIVAWLTREKFYNFGHHCKRIGNQKRKFERFLMPNTVFLKKLNISCEKCSTFTLRGEPVFFLSKNVLSAQNKGPTLESVLCLDASTQ